MADKDDKSIDILGLKPLSSSIEKVTDGVVDAARAFLSRERVRGRVLISALADICLRRYIERQNGTLLTI